MGVLVICNRLQSRNEMDAEALRPLRRRELAAKPPRPLPNACLCALCAAASIMRRRTRLSRMIVGGCFVGATLALLFACRQDTSNPSAGSTSSATDVDKLAHLRNAAIAHMDADLNREAIPFLDELAALVPDEPMVYANRALATMRSLPHNDETARADGLSRAKADLERALQLAPNDARIRLIRAGLAVQQDAREESVPLLSAALEVDPNNLRARFALVDQLATPDDSTLARQVEHLEHLLELVPTNFAVLRELLKRDAKLQRSEAFQRDLDGIGRLEMAWQFQDADGRDHDLRPLYDAAVKALQAGDVTAARRQADAFYNVSKISPRFQNDLPAVKRTDQTVGDPIQGFIATVIPIADRAAAAIQVAFRHHEEPARLSMTALGGVPLGVAWRQDRVENPPELVTVDGDIARLYRRSIEGRYTNPELTVALTLDAAAKLRQVDAKEQNDAGAVPRDPSQPAQPPGDPRGDNPRIGVLVTTDWNHDALSDLVYGAHDGKVYLLPQVPDYLSVQGSAAKPPSNLVIELPPAEGPAPVEVILPFDADQDGDLDLLVGRRGARTALLRYNGDGTFAETGLDTGLASDGEAGLVAADIGDFDDDGDLDLVAVDASDRLRLFDNRRSGKYVAIDAPTTETARAVAVADLNNDGRLDIVLLGPTGGVTTVTRKADGGWTTRCIGTVAGERSEAGSSIQTCDYDNDGWLDLLAVQMGSIGLWRNTGGSEPAFEDAAKLLPSPLYLPPHGTSPDLKQGEFVHNALPADVDRDGDLDLLLTFTDGHLSLLENDRGNKHHWYNLQLRAVLIGDQRNNSFGVGSSVEVKAGRAYQRRIVRGPVTHLGLGAASRTDTIRVVWPNGSPQHILLPPADVPIAEDQRLKGSCPFLFAWDGSTLAFVTDLIWRSPLGMRINGQVVASPVTTQDYVKVRAEQLVPRDGRYNLKIAAVLWETMFFDEVKLMCVDHPADVQVFVDERFTAPEPLPFVIYAIPAIQPVVAARDHRGRDVLGAISDLDARYLDGFAKGKYQGVAEDHYVEVDLGLLPEAGAVRLIASGWIHPTDSSLNVAIAQGNNAQPRPLSVWVADGTGGWTEAIANAGFPAGKHKTAVLDLTGKFAGDDHRVRLRTNLEIYWDRIVVGLGDASPPTVTTLEARTADLGWFGVPAMVAGDETSPELPDMDDVRWRSPWRDLIGWYSHYGDVHELLTTTDDRFVIMNAGDAITLSFDAPPPVGDGWTRDFVFFSDGWVKDGDWNTVDSKTVGPLPFHAMTSYPYPPNDAPAELRLDHPDWSDYHTRLVMPVDYGRRLAPTE